MSDSPVRLRTVEFDRLCNAAGFRTARQRCSELKMSPAQLAKVRTHKSQPGPKFIDRAQRMLKVPYAAIFETDADTQAAA